MTIWEPLRGDNKTTKTCMKGGMTIHKLFKKITNMFSSLWWVKKPRCSFYSFYFLFSHLCTMLSLPQGRLIKTNAIVNYRCYAGAQKAAGSYFSFSLVWWCDFVFFRNRFVSNGSVYLSSLSPFPHSLCARVRMENFGLHCHITKSLQTSELH